MRQHLHAPSTGSPAPGVAMTIAETADFLRIRSSFVAAAVASGDLPAISRNGVHFVDRTELFNLLRSPARKQTTGKEADPWKSCY